MTLNDFIINNEIPESDFVKQVCLDHYNGLITVSEAINLIKEK